jgi:hypothetical protein
MKKLIVLVLLCSCSQLAYAADNNYNPPGAYHQMSDDGYVSIPLPFTFTFFNQPFTTSWMYDNGIISFKQPFTNGAALPYTWWVPNPSSVDANYFIASLYADIAPKNGVTKYITQGDATSMKYIWQDIAEYYSLFGGAQTRYSTFSTTINSDGSIATHYTALNLQTSNVLAAVVGNISAGEITTFYSASYGAHITGGISDWSVAGVPVYVPPLAPVPVYIIPVSDPVDTSGDYIDPNNYNGTIDPNTYNNSTGMVITDTTTSPDPVSSSTPPPSTEPITLLLPPTPPPPSEPPPASAPIGSAPAMVVNGAPQSAAPGGAPVTTEQSAAPPPPAPLPIASPAAISPASLSPTSSAGGKSSIDVMSISRAAVQKTNALENSVVGGSIDFSMQSATSSIDASSSVSSVTGGSTESASASSSSSSSSSSQRSSGGSESSSVSQASQQTDSQSTSAASGTQSTTLTGGPQTTATSTITSTIQAMDGNADNTQTSGVVNLTSAPEQLSSAPLINSKDIVKDGITVYNSTFEVDATAETNTINSIIADSALKSPTLPEVTAVADETNPTSVRSLAAMAALLNTQIEDQIDQDQKKVNEIVQKSSVDINELALGGIELAQFQVVPIGYNTYLTLVMKDAKFYDPKEVYRNQTVIDNAPVLRKLNFASDSKFEKMVDQQYKAEQ